MEQIYPLLADFVLVLHALIVAFNVAALPVIWIGNVRGWRFVRNFYLRIFHLLLMGIIAVGAVFGIVCPLTTLEANLRLRAGAAPLYENGFVSHWLHRAIFWDLNPAAWLLLYGALFVLVLATFVMVRPNWRIAGE